jgi:hypothetical protein
MKVHHLNKFALEEIFSYVGHNKKYRTFLLPDGKQYNVRANSLRLQLFKQTVECVDCGCRANTFCIDCTPQKQDYHLNLYHCYVDRLGETHYTLMTQDHIIPISHGGPNELWNLQVMCSPCNKKKDNDLRNLLITQIPFKVLARSLTKFI